MKLRRFFACMMALLLVCSLPLSAFAAEYDIANGSIEIHAPAEGSQTVAQGGGAAVPDNAPVITGTTTTNTVTINADAGATANVTLENVNIDTRGTDKAAVEIKGNGDVVIELDGSNTVQSGDNHAGVEKNNSGNLTITDENGTDGSLEATGGDCGSGIGGGFAGSGSNIKISGSAEVTAQGGNGGAGIGGGNGGSGSNITIEGSAEVDARGGKNAAGIGGGFDGSGSNIKISGSAEVTAEGGYMGSGIGGGADGSGSNIKISGSAEVTAQGGNSGSGIGGGYRSTGSYITVSEDAQVKAQGGNSNQEGRNYFSAGAAIGDGGKGKFDSMPDAGQDVTPNTDELTPNGKIEYYAPGADIKTAEPTKTVTGTYVPPQPTEPVQPAQPEEEAPQIAAPYRVVGQDGKNLACKKTQSSGVLTITVDADFATLTGSASGLKTLKAQGVETIVFVTTGATSTFAIADLLAQVPSGSTYALTHVGSLVTLTLSNGMDISSILK